MPNGLATLLNLKKVDPLLDETLVSNDPYDSMISDQDLMDAQGAIGDAGAASGRAFYVPSRQSLREQGTSKLRQLFGIKQADAEAKAYPERLKGEYALREAQTKGEYDVRAAQAKAQQDADRLSSTQAFTAGQNDLNRQSRADLQAALQKDLDERAKANQDAIASRQMTANASASARKAPPQSAFEWIKSLFGSTPEDSPETIAADIAHRFPQASFDDLVANGVIDGSPEDLQQLRAALVKARGF